MSRRRPPGWRGGGAVVARIPPGRFLIACCPKPGQCHRPMIDSIAAPATLLTAQRAYAGKPVWAILRDPWGL
jgi:hypothetical protein